MLYYTADNVNALVLKSMCLTGLSQYGEALKCLRRARQCDPDKLVINQGYVSLYKVECPAEPYPELLQLLDPLLEHNRNDSAKLRELLMVKTQILIQISEFANVVEICGECVKKFGPDLAMCEMFLNVLSSIDRVLDDDSFYLAAKRCFVTQASNVMDIKLRKADVRKTMMDLIGYFMRIGNIADALELGLIVLRNDPNYYLINSFFFVVRTCVDIGLIDSGELPLSERGVYLRSMEEIWKSNVYTFLNQLIRDFRSNDASKVWETYQRYDNKFISLPSAELDFFRFPLAGGLRREMKKRAFSVIINSKDRKLQRIAAEELLQLLKSKVVEIPPELCYQMGMAFVESYCEGEVEFLISYLGEESKGFAFALRGHILQRGLKLEEAVEQFERALEFDSDNIVFLLAYANALYRTGALSSRKFEKTLKSLSAFNSPYLEIEKFKVLHLVEVDGNREDAMDVLPELYKSLPDDPIVVRALSTVYLASHDDSSHLELLERYYLKFPDCDENWLLYRLALLKNRKRNFNDAIGYLRRLAAKPGSMEKKMHYKVGLDWLLVYFKNFFSPRPSSPICWKRTTCIESACRC